jgi:hypothetical protein
MAYLHFRWLAILECEVTLPNRPVRSPILSYLFRNSLCGLPEKKARILIMTIYPPLG